MIRFHWLLLAFLVGVLPTLARAGEIELRATIADEFEAAFARGEFGQIEKSYAEAVSATRRLPSGVLWSGELVRNMFKRKPSHGSIVAAGAPLPQPGDDPYWKAIEEKASAWAAKYPHSALPVIALSQAHIRHAFEYRGGGYASTVTESGMEKFRVYVGKAQEALMSRVDLGRADPNWWNQILYVAQLQGMPRENHLKLANTALDAFPRHYDIYFTAAQNMLPQWGGNLRMLSAFADDAVKRTKATEGSQLYARIYWSASSSFGADFFKRPEVSWPKVRSGFEDMVQQYPDPWNLNAFARFACDAEDKPTTRKLMARIKESPEARVWGSRANFNRCMTWAEG